MTLLVVLAVAAGAAYVVLRGSGDPDGPPGTQPTGSPTPTSTSAPPEPTGTASSPTVSPSPTGSPCPPGPTRTLRVLTFNIHGALNHDGYDLGRVAEEIRAWKADVVLLQEVDRHRARTDFDDQPVALAAALDMFASYGANVVRPSLEKGGKEQEYGTLTLSRYPVLDSENLRLPNRPGLERRGLLRTTVDVDGAAVDLYNTHLQHTSGAVRRDQVRAIKEVLRTRDLPSVLGGDFNAEPDSRALALLTGWRFADPWAVVGADEGLTVPAGEPQRRIDFVLHDDAFTPVAAEDLRSAVSDHRAVRVVLDLVDPPDCG